MKIYLYGAGRNGKRIYNLLMNCKNAYEAAGFIESNPKCDGIRFCDRRVYSLENFIKTADEDFVVILTPDLYASIGIADNLKAKNIKRYLYWDYVERAGIEEVLEVVGREDSDEIFNRSLLFENELLSYQVKFLMNHIEPSSLKPADEEERQKQLNLVKLAKDFQTCLAGQDIELFLIGGNLLGYVRHNAGFIPWDDDLDMAVMEEKFQMLKAFCLRKLPYYEYEGIYDNTLIYAWYDEMTAKHPDEMIVLTTPLLFRVYRNHDFIDILPIRGYKDSVTYEEHSSFLDEYRKEMANSQTCEKQKELIRKVLAEDMRYVDSKGQNWTYSPLTWECYYSNSGIRSWFLAEDIFPLQTVVFEQEEFLAPNNIAGWLETEFGKNYMQLPKNLGLHIH